MRTTSSRLLLLLFVTILVGACGSRQAAEARRAEGAAPLRVENRSWADMRVYVATIGQRSRLGTVPGNSSMTLEIPAHIVSGGREVTFEVDPVGSRATATSYRIYVRPGEQVTLTIPPQVR